MGPVGGSWGDFPCLIGSVESGVVRTKASLLLGRKVKWVIIRVGRTGAVTRTGIASAAENAQFITGSLEQRDEQSACCLCLSLICKHEKLQGLGVQVVVDQLPSVCRIPGSICSTDKEMNK